MLSCAYESSYEPEPFVLDRTLLLAVGVLLLFVFGVADVTTFLFVGERLFAEHGLEVPVALISSAVAIKLVHQPASKSYALIEGGCTPRL